MPRLTILRSTDTLLVAGDLGLGAATLRAVELVGAFVSAADDADANLSRDENADDDTSSGSCLFLLDWAPCVVLGLIPSLTLILALDVDKEGAKQDDRWGD